MNLMNRVMRRAYYELNHQLRIEYHKYKYMSDARCINHIARMAIKQNGQQETVSQTGIQLKNKIKEDPDDSVTVVLEFQIRARYIKLIKGLKDAGISVKVAIYCNVATGHEYEELLDIVDECSIYHNTGELMYDIIRFNSFIVHYCTDWAECDRVASLLCHKALFPPIVVERYDVLSEMYSKQNGRYMKQNMRMERKCFEMADAICAREYTIDFLRKEKGYHISAKDIVFLDYVEMA